MNHSRSFTLSVLRGISHELRRANPNVYEKKHIRCCDVKKAVKFPVMTLELEKKILKPVSQTTAFSYLMNEYRKHQVTEKRTCKSAEELSTMAKTYLCYLQSLRENQELIDRYHGHGERSVEETARLVGFALPKSANEESSEKET